VVGYTEGKNIRVLYRYAENAERLSAHASELVSLGAVVIVTAGTTAIRAAHDAVPKVPIVSFAAADPVWVGWAKTMARPGGMITGVFVGGSNAKRFELLHEVLPLATIGYLINTTNPATPRFREGAKSTARALGINLETIEVKVGTRAC
jgi:putative ABC transport system substrate-binding protein